jgi:phosphate transport system substrate-binding protein
MKKTLALALFTLITSGPIQAQPVQNFQGSDSLAGVISDAIIAAGMNQEIAYLGGGSGKGESAIMTADQGIAPMSREVKPEVVELAKAKGIEFIPHVIALDGLGVFVHRSNPLQAIDLGTVAKIFTCAITQWEQIPGSNRTGAIHAFRRNDASGTTDSFKHFTAVKSFGSCVTVMNETNDIAEKTASDADAIGYSGATAKRDGNRDLAISRGPGENAIRMNVTTVRDFSYPMARRLYVYEVGGIRKPNAVELRLLENLTDRSFMDSIVQDHEFYTID